ncbi:hypothetical protein HDU76_012215 [Blyttiomyces sp. JEL0837]|nr:hypothetical protein HDU76_012215 [Blyttiomyces sp. JEL0837]
MHLQMLVFDRHRAFVKAAESGPFIPDQIQADFLEAVIEPDVVDGWKRVGEQALLETNNLFLTTVKVNVLIFVLEMVLVFVGQFVVVAKMMGNFRFTDQCIFDLLNRLPHQVKKLPEVSRLLANNGVVTKNAVDALSDFTMQKSKKTTVFTYLKNFVNKKDTLPMYDTGSQEVFDDGKDLRKKSIGQKIVTIRSVEMGGFSDDAPIPSDESVET